MSEVIDRTTEAAIQATITEAASIFVADTSALDDVILAAKAEGWDSAAVNLSGMGYTEQEALDRNPYRAEPGAQL